MLRKRVITVVLIFTLLVLAACTAAGTEPGADPEATATPEAVQVGTEAIEAAMNRLAEELGVEESAITMDSITDMEWSDSCLGLGGPAESCLQVITPGYLIILEVNDRVYEVRTDLEGQTVRIQETSDTSQELPAAVVTAQQAVAEERNVEPAELSVASFERREWSDSCLGLGGPEESCLQVITPGWLIMLDVEGRTVEVRTDETGDTVRIQETSDATQELPEAVVRAQQVVAEEQNVEPAELSVASFERREWSDSCLGLGGPAESCLQAITPGWLIMLDIEGRTVEVRTDETGDTVRLASKESMGEAASGAAIVLSRSGGFAGGVTEWRVYADGRVERVTGLEAVDSEENAETAQVEPEMVDELLDNLEENGFFALTQSYVPGDTCCDRYIYNLSVNAGDRVHAVSAVEATEDVPESVWESIDLVQQFVESQLTES